MGKKGIFFYIAITIVGIGASVLGGNLIGVPEEVPTDLGEPLQSFADFAGDVASGVGVGILILGLGIIAIGVIGIYKNK